MLAGRTNGRYPLTLAYICLGSKLPPCCWLDCNVVNGRYRYLTDLLPLDSCRPCNEQQTSEPAVMGGASSSVDRVQAWRSGLDSHPDKEFSRYILDGLSKGFRIGFDYSKSGCRKAKRNLLSVRKHPTVVDEYLYKEDSVGRLVKPHPYLQNIQISPFGVIPKPRQPGQWRLIVDLSAPRGSSVNDGISKEWCSLAYARVDDAARRVIEMGQAHSWPNWICRALIATSRYTPTTAPCWECAGRAISVSTRRYRLA